MSVEERQKSSRVDEKIGLLLGYHQEMNKDAFDTPTAIEQCCAVYCARNSYSSWAFAVSACCMIMGTLCTLYGYFLPSMYLSLSPEVYSNITIVGSSRIESERKAMSKVYYDRDVFLIVGLSLVFLGGLVLSLAMLVPLYIAEKNLEQIPSSSRISVKNELRLEPSREENCIQANECQDQNDR